MSGAKIIGSDPGELDRILASIRRVTEAACETPEKARAVLARVKAMGQEPAQDT